jgi:phosphinothricin acetyltransferase
MPSAPEASIVVRSAAPGDTEAVAGIYNHYVADTIVTFEEEPVRASEFGPPRR